MLGLIISAFVLMGLTKLFLDEEELLPSLLLAGGSGLLAFFLQPVLVAAVGTVAGIILTFCLLAIVIGAALSLLYGAPLKVCLKIGVIYLLGMISIQIALLVLFTVVSR
ncbi:MAG: hypothetical protein ACRC46_05030 [Thermoguttaceae bacterium]